MPRLMSVSLTEQAVRGRTKTVTRRLGSHHVKPGDHLMLCRKVMGRKPGEPLARIAEVEVVSARRARLWDISDEDVEREGFPEVTISEFLEFLCEHMNVRPDDEVTRIEWRYLNEDEAP